MDEGLWTALRLSFSSNTPHLPCAFTSAYADTIAGSNDATTSIGITVRFFTTHSHSWCDLQVALAPNSTSTASLIADCGRKDTVIEELLKELQKLRAESQASAAAVAAATANEMVAASEGKRISNESGMRLQQLTQSNQELQANLHRLEAEHMQTQSR